MPRAASPHRVQAVYDRLARYYEDDPDLLVSVRFVPRQGAYIAIAHADEPNGGLLFHVDQLDNGASGFRDEALRKIQSFREGIAYVPTPIKPGLRYDDVMTHSSLEAPDVSE